MLIYEDLKDFVEEFKQAEDKQVYVNENRMISKEGMLSGEILLQFHSRDCWNVMRYKEDIPVVEIVPEVFFTVMTRLAGVEETKKTLDKYNEQLKVFEDKIKKALNDSVDVFKQYGTVHTNIIYASG